MITAGECAVMPIGWKLARGIILEIGRQHRRGHMRAHRGREQGVAVGCRAARSRAAHRAASAPDVLDDDCLLEELGHLIGDDARHHIACAPGGKGHDGRDRARG